VCYEHAAQFFCMFVYIDVYLNENTEPLVIFALALYRTLKYSGARNHMILRPSEHQLTR
jgi:hypothetical protein